MKNYFFPTHEIKNFGSFFTVVNEFKKLILNTNINFFCGNKDLMKKQMILKLKSTLNLKFKSINFERMSSEMFLKEMFFYNAFAKLCNNFQTLFKLVGKQQ